MTRAEEIIRCLEGCLGNASRKCEACPFRFIEIGGYCLRKLMADALELIRQLRAQNETQADTIKQLIAAFGDQLPRPRRKEEQV